MSDLMWDFWGLVFVGFIWGSTNPFMKKKTTNIKKIQAQTLLGKLLAQIIYIFTNWKFISIFLINQIGSVLYFFLLQHTDLSLAVPVANSTSFLFTALTGWFLGEQMPNTGGLFGIFLITIGISLCIYDKTTVQNVLITE